METPRGNSIHRTVVFKKRSNEEGASIKKTEALGKSYDV